MEFDFESLLLKAQRSPPDVRNSTATGFSKWVFKLYNPPIQGKDDEFSSFQKRARICEQEINEFLLWFCPDKITTGWEPDFIDPVDNFTPPFLASALTINGEPLRCIPDVVLRNRQTGNVIIIERKTTRVLPENVPSKGWPNLRAQLWCYRWIDKWKDAPRIFLVGDIWHDHPQDGLSKRNRTQRNCDGTNKELHKQMNLLFEAYGGRFSANSKISRAALNRAP